MLDTDPEGPTIYGRYRDYCLARKTAGWKVLAFTLHGTGQADHVQADGADCFDAQVRAPWATFPNALYDVVTKTEFANPFNTTYFSDGLHSSYTGREIIAVDVATMLARLGVKKA
jgi:hypothetical protein